MTLTGSRGEYEILERIGVGGMAEVFRARAGGRVVAIKRLLPGISGNQTFVTMFVDEAKIVAQLDHRNIVRTIDVGCQDGDYFIVMEYIHGVDLKQLFDRCQEAESRMPISLTCTIIARVCDALSYAHNTLDAQGRPLGVVHRDVSPANVLVSFDGETKLIDFGVAKARHRLARTRTGFVKGKVAYVAPEILRGGTANHSADVFAAGVVLWELLTGARLFDSPTDFGVLELIRVCRTRPPSALNPKVPPELDHIVGRALAREPVDRYKDAIELHDDLQDFLGLATPAWTTDKVSRWLHTIAGNAAGFDGPDTEAKTRLFLRGNSPPVAPPPRATVQTQTPQPKPKPQPTPAPEPEPEATPQRATVSFDSHPTGASVFLIEDGQRRKIGTTPVSIELDPDTACDVSMRKRGYTAWTKALDLRANRARTIVAKLSRRDTGDDAGSGEIVPPPSGFVPTRDATTAPTHEPRAPRRRRLGLLLLLLAACVATAAILAPDTWRQLYSSYF